MVSTWFQPYFHDYFQIISRLFPSYFHVISKLFPKSHSFLYFPMVFTLFPSYFQIISILFLGDFSGYFQNLTVSCIFPWFPPYFHLISTLFPNYFHLISMLFLGYLKVISMVSTLFPTSHCFLFFFPWFSPYFHAISMLFPRYFHLISKISQFPIFFHGFHFIISTFFQVTAMFFPCYFQFSLFLYFFMVFTSFQLISFPNMFNLLSNLPVCCQLNQENKQYKQQMRCMFFFGMDTLNIDQSLEEPASLANLAFTTLIIGITLRLSILSRNW